MTAMTAATLDQLSDGRMLLGIGSSGPQVAEGWHGAALRPPAPAHARVRRGRAQGAGARAPRVPRRDARAAAARRARQGAEADDRAGAGAHPDLPGGDRPEEHARWPARSPTAGSRRCSRPSTSPSSAPLLEEGAARGGPLARRLRHRADGATSSSPTTSRARATPCARSSRSTSAGWARASRTSTTSSCSATASRTRRARSRTSTSTASATRRWRRCPTSSSTLVALGGPARPRARAPGRLPRRRRRHAGRHADGVDRDGRLEQLRLVAELAGA